MRKLIKKTPAKATLPELYKIWILLLIYKKIKNQKIKKSEITYQPKTFEKSNIVDDIKQIIKF